MFFFLFFFQPKPISTVFGPFSRCRCRLKDLNVCVCVLFFGAQGFSIFPFWSWFEEKPKGVPPCQGSTSLFSLGRLFHPTSFRAGGGEAEHCAHQLLCCPSGGACIRKVPRARSATHFRSSSVSLAWVTSWVWTILVGHKPFGYFFWPVHSGSETICGKFGGVRGCFSKCSTD